MGRSRGEGNGNPLPYSCLENSTVRGTWWATIHGVAKSWTRLSDLTLSSSPNPKVGTPCLYSWLHLSPLLPSASIFKKKEGVRIGRAWGPSPPLAVGRLEGAVVSLPLGHPGEWWGGGADHLLPGMGSHLLPVLGCSLAAEVVLILVLILLSLCWDSKREMSHYQTAVLFETETELTAFSNNILWAPNAEIWPSFIKVAFQKLSLARLLLTQFCEEGCGGSSAKLCQPVRASLLWGYQEISLSLLFAAPEPQALPWWVRTSQLNSWNREPGCWPHIQGTLSKSLTSPSLSVLTCKMGILICIS